MKKHLDNEENLPEIDDANLSGLQDSEMFKYETAKSLINKLLTTHPDREVEITDLTSSEIRVVARMKFYDAYLGFPLFGNLTKDFMRLKFSQGRKSRTEILKAFTSIFSYGDDTNIHEHGITRTERIKQVVSGFIKNKKDV